MNETKKFYRRYILMLRDGENGPEGQLLKNCGKVYVYWSDLDLVLRYGSTKLKTPIDINDWV